MRIHVLHGEDLEFSTVVAPDVDLRVDPEQLRHLVRTAHVNLRAAHVEGERAAWAVVAIMGEALGGELHPIEPAALAAVGEWMRGNLLGTHMFWYLVHRLLPSAVVELAMAIIEACPTAVHWAFRAGEVAPGAIRASIQKRIAVYPLDAVREHYFAMLGKHRRLLPPGAIPTTDFTPEVLTEVLRAGITDRVPAVRERAIAAAIGMNVVGLVRDEMIARLDDESMDVRQYALVALGTLDDAATRARLEDRLDHGTQEETTSAIWGLARRPDGLERVLALARDPRAWVITELLGALADVSAPMTDEQIAALTGALADPRLPRAIERHLRRAREGGPEYGADGGWFVVRSGAGGP